MKNVSRLILCFLILTGAFTSCIQSGHVVQFRDCEDNSYLTSNGLHSSKISYRGDLQPSADDRDIVAVSEDGYLEISSGFLGFKKRVVIQAGSDGPVKKYYEGRREKDFYPDGEEYLAKMLPDILRSGEIDLKYRLDRFYNEGGAEAVLAEIILLRGDGLQTSYFEALLGKELKDSEITETLKLAGKTLNSDHQLSSFLQGQSRYFFEEAEISSAFAEAVQSISSDHYKSELLGRILEDKRFEPTHSHALVTLATGIHSDYYQSHILVKALESRKIDSKGMLALFAVTKNISSDHYSAEVLKALAKDYELSRRMMGEYCLAMAYINSCHYLAEVAKKMLKENQPDGNVALLLHTVSNHISSDHYTAEVLKSALKYSDLQDEGFEAFLKATVGISSNHYTDEVLQKLLEKHEFSSGQREYFRELFPHHLEISSL